MFAHLGPDAVLEPLVGSWPADAYIIAPLTTAMTVAANHLPILRSFVARPKLHQDAVKMPKLAGGPFVDVAPERVAEVAALLAWTEREHAPLVGLAEAIKSLELAIAQDTSGQGLEAAWAKVPPLLRGFVELRYDLQHRASARYLEPMFYKQGFYREASQSFTLEKVTGDRRAFWYSTPRFAEPGRVMLAAPFADERIDMLCRARTEAVDVDALADAFTLAGPDRAAFAACFRASAPPPAARYTGPGMRVRYFGHASLLLESADVAVLVDPTLGPGWPGAPPRYSWDDLPARLDYVFITHAHSDHYCPEILLQLRHRTGTVVVPRSGGSLVDPSLELMLRAMGFKHVVGLGELDRLELPGGHATAIPFFGEHGDLDIQAKASWAIRLAGRGVLVASDAQGIEPRVFELLSDELADLDALFLAMEPNGAPPLTWGYGPMFAVPPTRAMDQARRQRTAIQGEIVQILARLAPKAFYNYAMGLEPWLKHVMGLGDPSVRPALDDGDEVVRFCKERGIVAERLHVQKELYFRST